MNDKNNINDSSKNNDSSKKDSFFSKVFNKLGEIPEATLWDEKIFLEKVGKPIDAQIIETVEKAGLTFQGGELLIETRSSDDVILLTAKCYYQDEKEKWLTKTVNNKFNKVCFEENWLKDLEKKGTTKYPIESPIE